MSGEPRPEDFAYRLNYAMAHDILVACQTKDRGLILGRVDYTEARPRDKAGPRYRVGGRWVELRELTHVRSRRAPGSAA